jgi:hypothetical protein
VSSTFRRSVRLVISAALPVCALVPLLAQPSAATGPTITRATVAYVADTNGDFFYGVYAAPASNPSARVAVVPESPQTLDVLSATVSPDGTKVAAEVDRLGDGDYSLEIIDVATGAHSIAMQASHSQNFTAGYGVDGYDFSRDGATLTYAQTHWSTSPGGTRSFTETLFSRPTDLSTTATAVNGGAGLAYPAYSQDGTKLAATNLTGPNAGLYVVDLSTGTTTKLSSSSDLRFRDPSWSPDDKTIAVTLAHLDPNSPVAITSDIYLYDPAQPFDQTPTRISPAGNTHFDYQRVYFAMDGSLWFDRIDSTNCCSGDLWQAHKNSSDGWTLTNRTPTTSIDEGGPVLPRPVDDGAPTSPVTLDSVGLAGRSLVVRWTVPAGLDDYSHVVLHRTGGTGPDIDIDNAFGTSYADSTVTLGQTYTYTATVYDGSGNAGPITTSSVTATASGVTLVAPSPTSTTYRQLPFTVTWGYPGQPTDPSITYDVRYAVKSGSTWALGSPFTWYSGTTLTHASFTKGVPGQTYYFQATVHDGHGNATSTLWKGVNVPLDQTRGSFSSGWVTLRNSQFWLGSLASTATNGASVSFTTTSKSEAIIGEKCPTCGTFAVYLDGHYRGTFNSASGSSVTKHRQVLWSLTNVAIRKHTVKIVAILPKGRVLRIDGYSDPR